MHKGMISIPLLSPKPPGKWYSWQKSVLSFGRLLNCKCPSPRQPLVWGCLVRSCVNIFPKTRVAPALGSHPRSSLVFKKKVLLPQMASQMDSILRKEEISQRGGAQLSGHNRQNEEAWQGEAVPFCCILRTAGS